MIIAAIALIVGGTAVGRIGWLAAADRLPGQGRAGIRTKVVMANDATWRAVHGASGAKAAATTLRGQVLGG